MWASPGSPRVQRRLGAAGTEHPRPGERSLGGAEVALGAQMRKRVEKQTRTGNPDGLPDGVGRPPRRRRETPRRPPDAVGRPPDAVEFPPRRRFDPPTPSGGSPDGVGGLPDGRFVPPRRRRVPPSTAVSIRRRRREAPPTPSGDSTASGGLPTASGGRRGNGGYGTNCTGTRQTSIPCGPGGHGAPLPRPCPHGGGTCSHDMGNRAPWC